MLNETYADVQDSKNWPVEANKLKHDKIKV